MVRNRYLFWVLAEFISYENKNVGNVVFDKNIQKWYFTIAIYTYKAPTFYL
jgi:hypothetical protein